MYKNPFKPLVISIVKRFLIQKPEVYEKFAENYNHDIIHAFINIEAQIQIVILFRNK